jgi:hypothetical protein
METSASSGRTKRFFHRKYIATIDVIEHALNVSNSYLAMTFQVVYNSFIRNLAATSFYLITFHNLFKREVICVCRY